MGHAIIGDIIYMTGGAGLVSFEDINYNLDIELNSNRNSDLDIQTICRDKYLCCLLYTSKKIILSNLKNKMPQLYAENIKDFNDELTSGRYFFRTCMEDLFNPDKIRCV